MKLTEKEKLLLKDLKTAEQLCIDKYTEYSNKATDKKLKNIFSSIKSKEEESNLGKALYLYNQAASAMFAN